MRPSGSQVLRVAAVLAVVTLCLLIVTEVTLRTLHFPAIELRPIEFRAAFSHDPGLGWLPVPGSAKASTVSRTVTVQHNSLGLRDIEFVPSARPVILFLGSSFVWGVDVEADERFTERLRLDLPNVNVVNAGIPAYSTDQEYLLLQRLWPHIKPDVVVLLFGSGDRPGNMTNFRFYAFKPYLANVGGRWRIEGTPAPKSPTQIFYNNWLAQHSTLARLAVLAYWRGRDHELKVPDPSEQLIKMTQDLVQSRHAKFLVGLHANDPSMEHFLSAQRIPYVTLEGAEVYPQWGQHWTPAGHVTIANGIKSLLAREGIISSTRESDNGRMQ